ncbi:MAG: VWA domain-containing protein, partial [Spirochaetes bacterium]|nr:VWA domain-containing protein [Spirochaetota bacterium]
GLVGSEMCIRDSVKYFPYVLVLSLSSIALFVWYLVWKRAIVTRLVPNQMVRERIFAGNKKAVRVKNVLIILAIILFSIAVLRPRWGEELRESSIEGVDLLVALDVSNSMRARDVSPNRLERAKDAVRILASSLQGDRIGLVLFAGEAFLQCPLTADLEAFNMFLNAATPSSVRIQGTDIGAAIDMAYRVFHRRRMTARNFVIITDGEDHQGKVSDAIEKFKELGVTVHVIGVGHEGGEVILLESDDPSGDVYLKDSSGNVVRTKLNQQLLRRIAESTGGTYFDINSSFSGVYRIIDRIQSQIRSRDTVHLVKQKKEQYYVFALLLIIILIAELLIPEKNVHRSLQVKKKFKMIGATVFRLKNQKAI